MKKPFRLEVRDAKTSLTSLSVDEVPTIVDADDRVVCVTSLVGGIGDRIVRALNDYDVIGRIGGRGKGGYTRRSRVLSGIENAIRHVRKMYLDDVFDSCSLMGEYSLCVRHNVGECPDYGNMSVSNGCQYDLQNVIVILENSEKWRIRIERIEDVGKDGKLD